MEFHTILKGLSSVLYQNKVFFLLQSHTYHKVNLVIGRPYHGCSPLYNSIMVDGAIVLLKKE